MYPASRKNHGQRLSLSLFLSLLAAIPLLAQSYTSYFIGNATDADEFTLGGTCLMGGAREDDGAMRWFLEQANGGDVLVLRTSGDDAYNGYFFTSLNVNVNSVETIVCHERAAASDEYVLARIRQAEAIWFAGGDQWTHLSRWQNTPLEDALRTAVEERNVVIGGTSAGMAILGGVYFSARNGTVTSSEALSNPYDSRVTIANDALVDLPFMSQVITDSHYDNPDRRGRHLTFLARAYTDFGRPYRGIACDEYTAVCIAPDGVATIYGGYPDFDDNAYFISPNCQLMDARPEGCTPDAPLDWDHSGFALQVYKVKGTPTGLYTFDLNTWQSGNGGDWEYWSASAGTFQNQFGDQPDCSPVATKELEELVNFQLSPNPVYSGAVHVDSTLPLREVRLYSAAGQLLRAYKPGVSRFSLPTDQLSAGLYWVQLRTDMGMGRQAMMVAHRP